MVKLRNKDTMYLNSAGNLQGIIMYFFIFEGDNLIFVETNQIDLKGIS